jgi:2-oxoacid:acceptor oxidoreductase delta subunit (pyruvate/2-ketoisovalerate family)
MMERPFAITLDVGSSRANKTGSWRTERPVYVHRLPPCSSACPAGEDVQQWLYDAEEGDGGYERAWRRIMDDNPFPAVMGRVCYHPCETKCNRGQLDEAVGINSVERFLGDEGIARGWRVEALVPPSGKRVLVVGAGPSGLSAAYHLARLGHAVTVYDAGPRPGGMMRFGIPKYRLPRDVLDAEIERILDLGVELELDRQVASVLDDMVAGGFDAVFLAVGAHLGKRAYIPAGSAAKVLDAVSLLRSMEGEEPPQLGRRVVVYGGGNTAIDAARTAKRLGAEEAIIVYRRTRERMPAHDFEVEEALEEGVLMKWLSTITNVDGGKLVVEQMELDETGFPQPTGHLEELEADSLVLALGQETDLSFVDGVPGLEIEDGVVSVDETMMTGYPGIFAGGDMVPAERTVTVAVGHGKQAARHIDAWLRSAELTPSVERQSADFGHLNTWYYTEAPRSLRPQLEAARRQSTFEEVVGGLDESTALYEARRCLSCGNCFSCDNCYGVCPDNAVIKLGGRDEPYAFDYDYCKGCGICAAECPCGAIEMVPEEI